MVSPEANPTHTNGTASRRTAPVVAVATLFLLLSTAPGAWARAGSTHSPAPSVTAATPSTMWAGYVATGQTFKKVKATWTEPALTCTPAFTAAILEVGLDDYSDSQMEQSGSFIECNSGSPTYALWYRTDLGTGFGVDIIHAGDRLTASVSYKAGTFTYSVKDATEPGESFTRTSGCGGVSCPRSSAEWMLETGDFTNPVPPLVQFASVHMGGGSATDDAGVTGPIDDSAWTATQLTLVDGSSNTMATSSALKPAGNAFKLTWKSGT